MTARVRVGLIGCGRIARVHRAYLQGLESVELVGVCDTDAGARASFAAEAGLAEFASVAELIERGRPQVAHVLTPPATHAPLALELLRAGVNVLVEKPLALDTAEAEQVVAAARRAGRWVSVDHNRWFDPVVQDAARAVEVGRLGELVGVEVFQGAEPGEVDKLANESSHWTARLPGGPLNNLASHPLYLMRRFAGPARGVRVLAHRSPSGYLEEVRLIADGERCLGAVTMSLHAQPFMNRLTLLGSRASLEVNLNNMTLIERRPRRLPKLVGKVWPNLSEALQLSSATVRNAIQYATGKQRFYPGIGRHLATLYASVAAGGEPPVSAAEGRDVVAWYDEILAQSAAPAQPAQLAS
ncbi:MAG: Gfo/Idh/MocA family oxidoreductase [Deltaproteobacteria bacterium]|nr:Gfo/Idh/MocA family oxidoreductase [Deltaproteobacteria bacterium]